MKPFNLAESKIAERNYCSTHLTRRLRIMALLVALMVLVSIGCTGVRIASKSAHVGIKEELADVQSKRLRIKQEKIALAARLSQRHWQRQLGDNSTKWLKIFGSVLRCVDENIWLKKVEKAGNEKIVKVEGYTISYYSLSNFMNKLKFDRQFTEVRLGSARAANESCSSVIDFSIELKLKDDENANALARTSANNVKRVPDVKGAM